MYCIKYDPIRFALRSARHCEHKTVALQQVYHCTDKLDRFIDRSAQNHLKTDAGEFPASRLETTCLFT